MRVTISRRDTADTAITADLLFSLHTQSSSLTPGPGSEVGKGTLIAGVVWMMD